MYDSSLYQVTNAVPTNIANAVSDNVKYIVADNVKQLAYPQSASLSKPKEFAIWGSIFVILGLCAAMFVVFLVVINKPYNTKYAGSVQLFNSQTPNTVKQLRSTYLQNAYGNIDYWTLNMVDNKLQYLWTQNNVTRVVWDSINASCGPNYVNYQAMISYLDVLPNTGTIYSNALGYSLTLGTTPVFYTSSGQLVQFRLQLYAGDLRIEALDGSGKYWSIFAAPSNENPSNWPSTNAAEQLVWACTNVTGNLYNAYFLGNGQLVVRTPFAFTSSAAVLWQASVNQPHPPLCT